MKIDIEALLAARREKRETRLQAQNDSELERRERRIQRQKENAKKDEERLREHATFVSGCLAEYLPTKLHHWFLLDNWTVQEGLILLCGLDPKYVPLDDEGKAVLPHLWADEWHRKGAQERFALSRIRRLDHLPLFAEMTVDILGEDRVNIIASDFTLVYERAVRIWKSGTHTELRYPPKYFIDWAISKKLPVDWLEWAGEHGYYEIPLPRKDQTPPSLSDEKPFSERERTSYLHIIGSLADLYWKAAHPGEEYRQTALIADLEKYDYPGMSERNLKEKLTKAMKAVKL